ncbi:hypothetical protein KHQ81_07830 [Mycoplasmatota bacterium]|nr:hypothetical protein KHQ81_07830 [Mycoplasmatota bacterium]
MKFHILDIFRIRKKFKEYSLDKKRSQEYRILKNKQKEFVNLLNSYHHIQYNINPFLYVGTNPKEVVYIEDIRITYQDYFEDTQPVLYIVRNPYIKVKQRKQLVNEIIKKWEYDYYKDIDSKLKRILEQASFIPVKRVEKIKNRRINAYMACALLFLILLRQYSFLQVIPYVGPAFTKINRLLIYTRYYNIASIIVYLSIVISMYLIIVKVYFDKVLKFGLSAKGFLIKERDRMLKKFKPNIKKIRKHLYKLTKCVKVEEKYQINELFNSKIIVKRIQRYGRNVINRVGIFTSYYKEILLVSKILRLIHFGLIIYLIISLFLVNNIAFW